jgi:hypothetical protein
MTRPAHRSPAACDVLSAAASAAPSASSAILAAAQLIGALLTPEPQTHPLDEPLKPPTALPRIR